MIRLSRVLMSMTFGFGVSFLAMQSGGAIVAQDKAKEKPKAKPRIAINDPEKLKEDKDFAIQGEYEGTTSTGDKAPVAAQVVAKGLGVFDVKILAGGLPGDGWDGKNTIVATARLSDDGAIEVTGLNLTGKIVDGKLTVTQGNMPEVSFKRIERKPKTLGAKPPEGAKVLFATAGDESKWINGKLVELSDGKFLNNGITSKDTFGNFKAHIEFRLPWMPNSGGQGRGNSGFYLQNRYELQILDSFGLKGENNECGGIYTIHKPLVNMCLPPMVWQTYDIEFTAARFDGDKKTANAKVTILHNGVKIHDNAELPKPTGGGQPEKATPGAIQLQNHGDPLVFRNVWVVEVK